MIRKVLCYSLFCLLLAVSPPAATAVGNPLAAPVGKEADTASVSTAINELSDAEIDANIVTLQVRVDELRLQYSADATPLLNASYQDVATPDELALWRNLANQLAGILEEDILTLSRLKDYRKELQGKLNEIKSWKGFAEKPPYSITLIDSLLDLLESKQGVLKSLDVINVSLEEEFKEFSNQLKQSSKQLRLAEEGLESNLGKPEELRNNWLLELARLQNEVNQAGTLYGERRRVASRERQKIVQADIDFVTQKLAIIRGNYRFSADELKEKQQAIDAQLSTLQLALQKSRSAEKNTRRELDRLDAAVSKAQADLAAGKRTTVSLQQLLKEQKLQRVVFENTTIESLIRNGLVNLLKREKNIWEDRYQIAAGNSNRELPRNELDLVVKWQDYITNKINAAEVLVRTQQERLSASPPGGAEQKEAAALLPLYQEQAAKLRQAVPLLKGFEQLVLRRNDEFKNEQQSLAIRLKNSFAALSELVNKVWLTELYIAEETIIIGDKKISRPRSVTIGKVVEAVLILLVGIWVINYLKKMFHLVATRRLKLADNEAHLYTRLLSYIMFIVVLVSSLIFVNIPLAIFTFFGGALAIGIGFGAQALISNFISGLILMFDKAVRMGDLVEVDGHRGRITSIGMRSSSIKRFDGVEMYVPNSAFLQQNVINWTASDTKIRYSIAVGVAYGSSTKIVERVLLLAVEAQPEVLRDPPPYIIFESFADSSLNFTAYLWLELTPAVNTNVVLSDIRHRIGERLDAAGISIPFPQRDLHLVGDQPLEVRMVAGEGA
jgi:small-conductance mechanosensitive channel